MQRLITFLASSLFASCAMHFHFHEAPRPETAQANATPEHSTHDSAPQMASETVRGIVRDTAGAPTRARVAAVIEGGSISTGTADNGRFVLSRIPWPDFVLNASTEDGRIAVKRSQLDAADVELVLHQGGTLVLELAGRTKTRCAIFVGDLRVEDFTLRNNEASRVIVPAGEVRVRLYDGDEIYQESHFNVAAGKTEEASFRLHS